MTAPDPAVLDAMIRPADRRERLGRTVRDAWVQWAREQEAPKPSWLALWAELDDGQREVDMRIGEAVANEVIADCSWCGDPAKRCPDCGMPLTLLHHDPACSQPCAACEPRKGEGQWLTIAFMGHIEYTGYVTEITRNGQPAYRIDLPERVWGGNPLAYVTHSASSWFSDRPVTEETVRAAWEAQQERARGRARMDAEWARRQQQNALEAGEGAEGCPETSDGQHTREWHEGGKCSACGQTGPQDDDDWAERSPF